MEVFDLTSIHHFVKLCTSSYIEEKIGPVSLLHARSVLVKIALGFEGTGYNRCILVKTVERTDYNRCVYQHSDYNRCVYQRTGYNRRVLLNALVITSAFC